MNIGIVTGCEIPITSFTTGVLVPMVNGFLGQAGHYQGDLSVMGQALGGLGCHQMRLYLPLRSLLFPPSWGTIATGCMFTQAHLARRLTLGNGIGSRL
jgi:hypothetical protein